MTYTLTLDKAATEVVDLAVAVSGTATSGTDFVAPAATLSFAVGQTSKTIDVVVNGDTTVEADETVILTFSGAKLTAPATATGTITNDDVAPSFVLTTGTDSGAAFTGTAADEIYTAAVLTLNNTDSLDGAGGTDTLNAEINANITNTFTTANIENVNVTALGAYSIDTKNMTGVTNFTTNNSAGALTLNTVKSAAMGLGFKGSDVNSITANYDTGVLAGTTDKLKLTLDAAKAVAVSVSSGFESIEMTATGASKLDTLTVPGVVDLSIAGSGTLELADNTINAIDNLTVTSTAAITLGTWTGAKNLKATANTGGIVGGVITAADGRADKIITTDSAGATIELGAGVDNINVASTALTSASTTIKLGAGNDIFELSANGSGATFIFGEDGDDKIAATGDLRSTDLVDGGLGTDTLYLDAATHALLAKGLEKVEMGIDNAAATSSLTFTSIDSAVGVTLVNTTAAQDVTVAGLRNGSTFAATKASVKNVAVGFKAGEAATINVDLQKGSTGDLTLTNAEKATATYGAASNLGGGAGAGDITLDAAGKELTVNATGAFVMDDILASGTEALTSVAITGSANVTIDDIANDNKLVNINIKSTAAAGAVTTGLLTTAGAKDMTAISLTSDGAVATDTGAAVVTAESLATGTFNSTSSTVTVGNISLLDAANKDGGLTTLSVSAKQAAAVGTVTADKLTTATVTSTESTAVIGAIDTRSGTAGAIGTITVTGKGTSSVAATTTTQADTIGTIKVTSTTGDALISSGSTVTVAGADAAVFTDGTVDLLEVAGYTAATIGAVNADVLTSAKATSTTTTAAIGNVADGAGTGNGTVGTLSASAYTAASVGNVQSAALTSVTATGTTTTAGIGNVTVTNAADTAVVTAITATGKTAVTVGDILVDNLTGLSATSTTTTVTVGKIENTANAVSNGSLGSVTVSAEGKATVGIIGAATKYFEDINTVSIKSAADAIQAGDITADDTNGFTVTLDAKSTIQDTGTTDAVTVTNSKGGATLYVKGAPAVSATEAIVGLSSTLTTDTVVTLLLDASGYAGYLGDDTATKVIVNNDSINTGASSTVKAAVGGSFVEFQQEKGSSSFYGNAGVDTVILSGTAYATSLVFGEAGADDITVGVGVDTLDLAAGADQIRVLTTTQGNTDVIDGGADTDTLHLAGASHTFATDGNLKNVENISIKSDGGVTVNLSGQTENFSTVTTSAVDAALVYVGSQGVDTVVLADSTTTGTTITLGKGDDVLTLEATDVKDTIIFADTAANNGKDTINAYTAGNGKDVLNFDAFLGAGSELVSVDGTTAIGATDAIAVGGSFTTSSSGAVALDGKVVVFNNEAASITQANLLTEFAASQSFNTATSKKAVILVGDKDGSVKGEIWYLDNSLDGNASAVSATDLVLVGVFNSNIDIDALTGNNIA